MGDVAPFVFDFSSEDSIESQLHKQIRDRGVSYFQREIRRKAEVIIQEIEKKTVEREVLSRILMLAILSQSNIFLIGEPGVAKSYILKLVSYAVKNGKYFEYLISPSTKAKEILGVPYEGENGQILYNTKDSVIDSHIVFLDEVYKGDSGIMNAMLGIASDNREYHQRGTNRGVVKTEVRCFMTVSNEFPSSDELAAFDDRLHFKFEVTRIKNRDNYLKLLRGEFDKSTDFSEYLLVEELDAIKMLASDIQVPAYIDEILLMFRDRFIREKLSASDRKMTNAARILKVSAFCNARDRIDISDLFLLLHLAWSNYYERDRVREVCFDIFFKSKEYYASEIQKLHGKLDEQFGFIETKMDDVLHKRVNLKPELIQAGFQIWIQNAGVIIGNLESLEKAYLGILDDFKQFIATEDKVRDNIFLVDLLKEEEMMIKKPYKRSFDDEMVSDIEDHLVKLRQQKRRLIHFVENCESPAEYGSYVAL